MKIINEKTKPIDNKNAPIIGRRSKISNYKDVLLECSTCIIEGNYTIVKVEVLTNNFH